MAQPKVYVNLPDNQWKYSDTLAARTYYFTWNWLYARDTTIFIYITQSVYWKFGNTEYKIALDSIKGRGDRRIAFVVVGYKVADTSRWYQSWYPFRAAGDTTPVIETKIKTKDSTERFGVWMDYTTISECFGIITSDATGYGAGAYYSNVIGNGIFTILLEKIIGDPTKFNGYNQMGKFRFKYRQYPSKEFIEKYLK